VAEVKIPETIQRDDATLESPNARLRFITPVCHPYSLGAKSKPGRVQF
jgi:hypothetical protein